MTARTAAEVEGAAALAKREARAKLEADGAALAATPRRDEGEEEPWPEPDDETFDDVEEVAELAEPEPVDELDEPGGDCPHFVQICRHAHEVGQPHGLKTDEGWALVHLALFVNYRSGEVSDTTRDEIADYLGWHRSKVAKVFDRFWSAGLVASHFPRGHRGWVALLCYPDIVHMRPSHVPPMRANLDRRRAEHAERGPAPRKNCGAGTDPDPGPFRGNDAEPSSESAERDEGPLRVKNCGATCGNARFGAGTGGGSPIFVF